MKYKEYKQIDYAKLADDISAFWRSKNIFAKSISQREKRPTFVFYEGPPSANGAPGVHHMMARAVKDIFCRYKTLKGFQVKRKGGWDAHGLPIELSVEKKLGITKEDIGKKISIEEYNRICREEVMKFKVQWDDLTQKMGYWVNLDDPYVTFDSKYMESIWSLLKQFYDKNLIYKDYTVQPYSPAAGTALSSHELNQPGCYKDVKDTSIIAQFKVLEAREIVKPGDYLLAWTTTPWTLPSNSALAVGRSIKYFRVKTFNPYTKKQITVIIAKDRFSSCFHTSKKNGECINEGDEMWVDNHLSPTLVNGKLHLWKVLGELEGSDLEGISYEQLLPYVKPKGKAFKVITADFVSTEDGTGIVHIAPTFGADDQRVARLAGIAPIMVQDKLGSSIPLVDKQGRFVPEMGEFAGKFVKEEYYNKKECSQEDFKSTDVLIAIKLKEENKAFKVEKYVHSYPHCWRTDKPVLYYPLESWFIKTTAAKDKLVALNKTINWKPESTGSRRFGNWLENLVDWNLSRSRFWGTPLPIWRTENGLEEKCIGSIAELNKEIEKAIEAGLMKSNPVKREGGNKVDLHRPFVDDVILVSDSDKPMRRELDLIDVWFDSGAMPYAQWHYPFENKEVFESNYPADFIAEGIDQTRGWFFTLHTIAGMLYDSVAFKNVIANGLVLDKEGNKMSKRLGNAIDPFEAISQYGPDATRWYMISNANPWDNLKFDLGGIAEVQRKFFGTLQNTYNFFLLYANLDSFTFTEKAIPLHQSTESDKWIISKLNSLIAKVDNAFAAYEPTKASRLIQDFTIYDLSNWYVRLNRKRFWVGDLSQDKEAAYQTLYICLMTLAKLISPIAPFYAEKLYQGLNEVAIKNEPESVHLCNFPTPDKTKINEYLEERMGLGQLISSLVHSLRKKHKIKVRQPLSRILIPVMSEKTKTNIQSVENIILAEVNVKSIDYIGDTSGIWIKTVKPNFFKLGKQFGSKTKQIAHAINKLSPQEIAQLEKANSYQLLIGDEVIDISLEDVEIQSEDIPGWSVASESGVTIALDITLSDELKQEGIARDLINRIQNMRKNAGLEVQNKIQLLMHSEEKLVKLSVENFKKHICTEVQALKMDWKEDLESGENINIDNFKVKIDLTIA